MSDLNKRAAERLGWHFQAWSYYIHESAYYKDGDLVILARDFDPEHNRDHAAMLLDKVAEEGEERIKLFIEHLAAVIGDGDFAWWDDMPYPNIFFQYIAATPAQITEAFVRTFTEERE